MQPKGIWRNSLKLIELSSSNKVCLLFYFRHGAEVVDTSQETGEKKKKAFRGSGITLHAMIEYEKIIKTSQVLHPVLC
jgi:hypothetical protein